jgi:hypothetical protein
MNEAATFAEVQTECLALLLSTILCLMIAATIFSWNE